MDYKAFRQEIRTWLDANCPTSMRSPAKQEEQVWGGRNVKFHSEDARLWFDRCVEKGYCARKFRLFSVVLNGLPKS